MSKIVFRSKCSEYSSERLQTDHANDRLVIENSGPLGAICASRFGSLPQPDPRGQHYAYQRYPDHWSEVAGVLTDQYPPESSRITDIRALKHNILKARLSLHEQRADLDQQRAKIRELEITLRKDLRFYQNLDRDLASEILYTLFEEISQALDVVGPCRGRLQ